MFRQNPCSEVGPCRPQLGTTSIEDVEAVRREFPIEPTRAPRGTPSMENRAAPPAFIQVRPSDALGRLRGVALPPHDEVAHGARPLLNGDPHCVECVGLRHVGARRVNGRLLATATSAKPAPSHDEFRHDTSDNL